MRTKLHGRDAMSLSCWLVGDVSFAVSQGRERFRVLSITKERPIMIAEVEELAEDTDNSEEVGPGGVW